MVGYFYNILVSIAASRYYNQGSYVGKSINCFSTLEACLALYSIMKGSV